MAHVLNHAPPPKLHMDAIWCHPLYIKKTWEHSCTLIPLKKNILTPHPIFRCRYVPQAFAPGALETVFLDVEMNPLCPRSLVDRSLIGQRCNAVPDPRNQRLPTADDDAGLAAGCLNRFPYEGFHVRPYPGLEYVRVGACDAGPLPGILRRRLFYVRGGYLGQLCCCDLSLNITPRG